MDRFVVIDPLDHDKVIAEGIIADSGTAAAEQLINILGYQVITQVQLSRQRNLSFNEAPADELIKFAGDTTGLNSYLDSITNKRRQTDEQAKEAKQD